MKPRSTSRDETLAGLCIALLVFLLGYLLFAYPSQTSKLLTRASYDWSFDLCSFARPDLSGPRWW